jgi:microcystin-dependent protein
MGIQINGQTDNIKANDGGFTVSSNLEPSANNTYDLGSATNKWNNFYVNTIYVNTIINSDTSGSGTVPIGSVFYFASSTRPDGYLVCNGATLSRTTYSTLFSIIGVTFGVGDGSTTFTLPDLRGEFIRGWDAGKGIDIGRVFGSSQASTRINTVWSSPLVGDNFESEDTAGTQTRYSAEGPFTGTKNLQQIRPRNVALLPCIKY